MSKIAVAWVFAQFTAPPEQHFFTMMSAGFYMDWNLIFTDAIAFLCIAFSRFSFQNELQRHKVETDHLQLQLSMLKTQLQPHFLFNTLNSLYGLSLTGSKETPRFILLLSQMMQYILYDCDKDEVLLADEVVFLQGYFEIEQKKFPKAVITIKVPRDIPPIKIPPLLFLPLVENSFKHGTSKILEDAWIQLSIQADEEVLHFILANSKPAEENINGKNGIGLANVRKRLELLYPQQHSLEIRDSGDWFIVLLKLAIK